MSIQTSQLLLQQLEVNLVYLSRRFDGDLYCCCLMWLLAITKIYDTGKKHQYTCLIVLVKYYVLVLEIIWKQYFYWIWKKGQEKKIE